MCMYISQNKDIITRCILLAPLQNCASESAIYICDRVRENQPVVGKIFFGVSAEIRKYLAIGALAENLERITRISA